jgi:hypothetical protein
MLQSVGITNTTMYSFYIENPIVTKEVMDYVRSSWSKIISVSAPGFVEAQKSGNIAEGTTPIGFFYETFFDIFAKKESVAVVELYRNNLKGEGDIPLLSVISTILNLHTISRTRWREIVHIHAAHDIAKHQYRSMLDSLILAIAKTLGYNNDEVYTFRSGSQNRGDPWKITESWRIALSFVVDAMCGYIPMNYSDMIRQITPTIQNDETKATGKWTYAKPKSFSTLI